MHQQPNRREHPAAPADPSLRWRSLVFLLAVFGGAPEGLPNACYSSMVFPDRRQAENAEIRRLLRNIAGNHGYCDLSIKNSIEAFAACGLLQDVSDD